ncbi:hypothetical protein Tco_0965614 [Tanacetum coccineum]
MDQRTSIRTSLCGNQHASQTRRQLDTDPEKGRGIDFEESFAPVARLEQFDFPYAHTSQKAKYALKILKKHNMDNCHSIGTPLATKPKLDVDLSGEPVDQSDYRSKIGSLMYLTSSRPDLVQAVCYCARYQARPTQKHLKEVKRIFKYLKGTINMGLWYPKDSGFELTAFSDADHAGCLDTRKSTSGGIQFLGDKLVSWMSKKQNCTAMSLAEAEYVALSASCAQVMWMRTQLKDYGFNYNKIPLYCDSQSAIAISCNPVQHSRTKHIHTRCKLLHPRLLKPKCTNPSQSERDNQITLGTQSISKHCVEQTSSVHKLYKSPTHYAHDIARTFRVKLFSIHSDEGNLPGVILKQHCGRVTFEILYVNQTL